MGLDHVEPLRDTFHPADDLTPANEYYMPSTAVVSCASSAASNGGLLHPMPGTYPTGPNRGVYRFTRPSPRFQAIPLTFGLRHPPSRTQPPVIEYDSSDSDTLPLIDHRHTL